MKGYVFIGNSSKPTQKEQNSRTAIKLSNVSKPCIKAAMDMGYEVWCGVNRTNSSALECDMSIHLYDSHTYRSLVAFKDNKIAYNNLYDLVKKNNIKVIHCNTPIGGMIGRLVGKKLKVNKVIYTAHGFHFYKGAPLFNNIILKMAEKIMAHWTDAIITMNEEDYEAAKKFKLKKNGKVYFVHGVGINLDEYKNIEKNRNKKRKELDIKDSDLVLISMGDLVKRKNYKTAIEAIAKTNNTNIKYLICGEGPEKENLKNLASNLNISEQVKFLGFRKDIKELLNASDIFLFTTIQEGLPRSMMEAMASGLPCIASRIRGNIDLIEEGKGGYLCEPTNSDKFAEAIIKCDKEKMKELGKNNLIKIKNYDIKIVEEEIKKIYEEVLD